MRVLGIWTLIVLLISAPLMILINEEPLSAKETIEQACSYKAVDEVIITQREYDYASVWSIQGIYYWDTGIMRLSKTDTKHLSNSLSNNPSFEKKELNGKIFYEMNIVGVKSSSCEVDTETSILHYSLSLS